MLSCYSSHSSLLLLEPIAFAPQHRDVQCKNGLSNGRPSLRFLVASPRPRPLPLPPTPKATTVTAVTASFASTTYNQEVIFSPAIIARHNRAILPWLANEPYQLPTPANTSTGQILSSARKPVRDCSILDSLDGFLQIISRRLSRELQ